MPPHIYQRKDRGFIWYIRDGRKERTTETKNKGLANHRLKQYILGQFGLGPKITVGEYYEKWIKTKTEPLFRRSCVRDYTLHFRVYILPELGQAPLALMGVTQLSGFRSRLLESQLSLKTVRNIVGGSLRALWRDALEDGTVTTNPFKGLKWPRSERRKPDPFTAQERDTIIEAFLKTDPFNYSWVYVLFHTGMRPSEASALEWSDIDLEAGTISITKSRSMGAVAAPKTPQSRRTIRVGPDVLDALKVSPSRALGLKPVFVNKYGNPVNSKKWGELNLKGALIALEIRHRKAYAFRHTFITEMVKRGYNLKAIAEYCGTSVSMIEQSYCGTLSLGTDSPVFLPQSGFSVVAGPGFEPRPSLTVKDIHRINKAIQSGVRGRKAG